MMTERMVGLIITFRLKKIEQWSKWGNRWENIIFKMGLEVHFANYRLEE